MTAKRNRFQDFRKTAAQWTSTNPRLYQGEVGYEHDTGKIKRGDGIRYWNDLAYWYDPTTLADATALIDAAEIRARRSALYTPFTPTGIDDEFDDGSYSGWTSVTPGTQLLTFVEANDCLSIYNPAGQAAASLRAEVKATTINANDIIETCVSGFGRAQNYNLFGLVFANGATYGAGAQIVWYYSPTENVLWRVNFTNYSAAGTATSYTIAASNPTGVLFLRLKYEGSNNWSGWVSGDNTQWVNVTGTVAYTMTPTHLGFFVTSWGGSLPAVWSMRYIRKTT